MKKLTTLAALVAVLLMAGSSFAQIPGDAGVFFDPAGTNANGALAPSIPTNIYVVAWDLAGDIFGYEFQMEQDPGLFVLSTTFSNPEAQRFGSGNEYLVGTAICLPGGGSNVLMTQQTLLLAPANDLTFCLGPPATQATAACGGRPCYLKCDETVSPFSPALSDAAGILPDGCAVANATQGQDPVGAETNSWGSLKAAY